MGKNKWQELSLREKIGQTIIWKSNQLNERQLSENTEEFLEKYPVGSIFVGAEVIDKATDGYEKIASVIKDYQNYSKVPLLICGDMESGSGELINGFTAYPSNMALGATGSKELAYAYGKGTALESVSIGINWSFSPVSDLNMNWQNPITNIRSISDKPEIAIPLLNEVIRGMQENGMAATVKHFPGDGVDYRDQHFVTTCNSLSLEDWKKNHGAVFKSLIDNGVKTIMTGHITLPSYQTEQFEDGRYLPATLSSELTTKLLKDEMGFKGVVVSDALVMGGFRKFYERLQGEVECFKAGTDMMLWPLMEYFDRMEEAILSGEVPMERLDDALERIWNLKESLGLFNSEYSCDKELSSDEKVYVKETANNVAKNSITLLKDIKGQIPFNKEEIKRVTIIGITHKEEAFNSLEILKKEFEMRGVEVFFNRNINEETFKNADKSDYIIYAFHNKPHQPMMYVGFGDIETLNLAALCTFGREKTIVVSFGSPYNIKIYGEAVNAYINTYSITDESQKAVVAALFGEIEFLGQSPVEL